MYQELLKASPEPQTDASSEELMQKLRRKLIPKTVSVLNTAKELHVQERIRPVSPGMSVSSVRSTAGTICCVVVDSAENRYILSAYHAFLGEPGDEVLQPGVFDRGSRDDVIASVFRVNSDKSGTIALLNSNVPVSPEVPGIGKIKGIGSVLPGDRLRMVGRTSGLTEGKVIQVGASVRINIGSGEVPLFKGLIVTTGMSAGGDSGAPVLNDSNELIGMVFGGSTTNTIVLPIKPLLDGLEVSLVK